MTQSEEESIQANALLRRHKARAQSAAHQAKVDGMMQAIETVALAWKRQELQVQNVNGKDRLCAIPGTFTPTDYPSHGDVVSAVQDFLDAVADKDKAEAQCRNLGLEP